MTENNNLPDLGKLIDDCMQAESEGCPFSVNLVFMFKEGFKAALVGPDITPEEAYERAADIVRKSFETYGDSGFQF